MSVTSAWNQQQFIKQLFPGLEAQKDNPEEGTQVAQTLFRLASGDDGKLSSAEVKAFQSAMVDMKGELRSSQTLHGDQSAETVSDWLNQHEHTLEMKIGIYQNPDSAVNHPFREGALLFNSVYDASTHALGQVLTFLNPPAHAATRDKDTGLDVASFQKNYFPKASNTSEAVTTLFSQADQDGDGRLDARENNIFKQAFSEIKAEGNRTTPLETWVSGFFTEEESLEQDPLRDQRTDEELNTFVELEGNTLKLKMERLQNGSSLVNDWGSLFGAMIDKIKVG